MYSRAHRPALRVGWRLALWFTLVSICITVLIFGATYGLVSRAIRDNNRNVARNKLEQYVQIEHRHGLPALLRLLDEERTANARTGFFVRVLDDKNRALLVTLPEGLRDVDIKQIEQRRFTSTRRWVVLQPSQDGETLEAMGVSLAENFQLQVGFGMAERKRLLGYVKSIFPLVALPMLLLGLSGGVFLANRALSPLRDLTRAVSKVEKGGFDARVPMPPIQDELHDLAGQFNTMIERIGALVAGMRGTLDNVAHDLRTPLMRLKLTVESALQKEQDPAVLREALLDCAEEAERIGRMLTTLMDISEAESGAMHLELDDVDLVVLAEEVVELYSMIAEDKQIDICMEADAPLPVKADTGRMRQVLSNLMDNALKYTPEKGRVIVTLGSDAGHAIVEIRDSGPGVPPEDRPHIFERLYRGDKSRSQRGLGLGLSLVQAVVHAHGGQVREDGVDGEGACFRVLLPLV